MSVRYKYTLKGSCSVVSRLGVTAIPLFSNQRAIYYWARLCGREVSRGIPLVIFFRERAIKLASCELALQQVLGGSTVLHPADVSLAAKATAENCNKKRAPLTRRSKTPATTDGELQQKESPFDQKEQTPGTTDGELQPEPPPLFFPAGPTTKK